MTQVYKSWLGAASRPRPLVRSSAGTGP